MAQENRSRILVGRREGGINAKSSYQSKRVPVIEVVHEQAGRWIVDAAKYGRPGGYMNCVAVAQKTRGTDVDLQFGRPVYDGLLSLEFVKVDTLAGTVLTHLGGDARIEFRQTR